MTISAVNCSLDIFVNGTWTGSLNDGGRGQYEGSYIIIQAHSANGAIDVCWCSGNINPSKTGQDRWQINNTDPLNYLTVYGVAPSQPPTPPPSQPDDDSPPWSWYRLGDTLTTTNTIPVNLNAGQIGYISIRSSYSGELICYFDSGGSDSCGWLTNGGCSLGDGDGPRALSGGAVYAYNDNYNGRLDFYFTCNVTADTTYEIDIHKYNSNYPLSGTLTVIFPTPPTYYRYLYYSANGGSNIPSTQTKELTSDTSHTFTISSTKPTRTGYTFLEWNTKSDGTGYSYQPGGQIIVTGSTTLHAIWKPNSYIVSYNLNGGNGTITNTTRYYNESYQLTFETPTRSGYKFIGWNTLSTATTGLAPGSTVSASTSTGTITYYAIWKAAFYWMDSQGKLLQDLTEDEINSGVLISDFINQKSLQSFFTKVLSLFNIEFDPGIEEKISTEDYNELATYLNLPLLTKYSAIKKGPWIELQNAYNNYPKSLLIDFDYIETEDGKYELTNWKGTHKGQPSNIIEVPDSNLIII